MPPDSGEPEGQSRLVHYAQRTVQRFGPIPDPDTLAAYKEVSPEVVEHILEAAKAEQAHRHRRESAKLDGLLALGTRALVGGYATIIVLVCGLAAVAVWAPDTLARLASLAGILVTAGLMVWRELRDRRRQNRGDGEPPRP